jgi:hypothetical protein
MNYDIFIERIGGKSDPLLIDLLRNHIRYDDLPDQCMVWTGRKSTEGVVLKKYRSGRDFLPNYYQGRTKSYAMIVRDHKLIMLHRFIYEHCFGPLGETKIFNSCSNTLCLNPRHWHRMDRSATKKDTYDLLEPPEEEPWTEEEVEQLIDIYLRHNDEVDLTHPDIAQIPVEMLQPILERRNKWPT